jgi:hypothetical protein
MSIKNVFLVFGGMTSLFCCSVEALTFSDTIKGIKMGGTERMMVFALSDPGLSSEAHAARNRVLAGMGIIGRPGTISRANLSFSPILTHESNVNGGYGNSTIVIDGLNFNIDEDYEAVDGFLLGGAVTTGVRVALGNRTALSISGGLSLAYSPENDMWKNTASVSACVNHLFTVQTWGYGCLDASYRSIELGETTRYGVRAGINRLFFSSIGLHEVTAEIQHNEHDGGKRYDQNVVSLSMTTSLTGGYSVAIGAQLGEKVDGASVMRHRFFTGIGFALFERPASISVGFQHNEGGMFLGEPVNRDIVSISLAHQITSKLSVSIYASKTDSNVAFYDENQFGVSIGYRF